MKAKFGLKGLVRMEERNNSMLGSGNAQTEKKKTERKTLGKPASLSNRTPN